MKFHLTISALIILASQLVNPNKGFSQDKKFQHLFATSITSLDVPGLMVITKKENLNRAFLFSVAITTNATGKIVKVTYTNQTPTLDSIVNFKNMTARIKKNEPMFLPYKNEVLIAPVMLQISEDWRIENVPEFRGFFTTLFSNLQNSSKGKKIHLLPTINWLPYTPIIN